MTEMLLGQKMILISIMFALVPLLAAAVLVVIARIRQRAAQRRLKQARIARRRLALAEAARAAQAAEPQSATPPINGQPVAGASSAPAAIPVPPTSATAGAAAPVAKTATKGAAVVQEQKPPEEQPATSSEQNKPANSAMQDILSSVFGDEEGSGRSEALLQNLDEVNITDLAVLCQDIAGKITPVAEQ